jgi:hypothetical protein
MSCRRELLKLARPRAAIAMKARMARVADEAERWSAPGEGRSSVLPVFTLTLQSMQMLARGGRDFPQRGQAFLYWGELPSRRMA